MKRHGFGQTVTEYLLIVGAIAILVFGVYQTFGKHLSSYVTGVQQNLFASNHGDHDDRGEHRDR